MEITYDIIYSIYDDKGKYVGFCGSELDAKQMAEEYNGHYDWEFCGSDSIFG